MTKKYNLAIGIIISFIFLVIYNVSLFNFNCENVRNNTIRLHIIASSDSSIDQAVKLKIRDELLEKSSDIFDGSITTENAKEKLIPKLAELKSVADKILEENNINYHSQVSLETEYFDTKLYKNGIKLPAGNYLALKIKLGEAKGKNWWCIMFPALCLPATGNNNSENQIENVYSDNEKQIIMMSDKYEIRFKLIEYIEILKNKVDNISIIDNA